MKQIKIIIKETGEGGKVLTENTFKSPNDADT